LRAADVGGTFRIDIDIEPTEADDIRVLGRMLGQREPVVGSTQQGISDGINRHVTGYIAKSVEFRTLCVESVETACECLLVFRCLDDESVLFVGVQYPNLDATGRPPGRFRRWTLKQVEEPLSLFVAAQVHGLLRCPLI